MAYITDRQRVEMLLFPMMAHSVILAGADKPDSPEAKEAIANFETAMVEATNGLDVKKAHSVMRRAIRLHEEIAQPFREAEARVDKVGLILYYILNWCIESGYLILHDDSPMRRGMDILLPAMEHSVNIAPLDRSAHKAATKLLFNLQRQGMFPGVPALDYVQ